MAESPKAYADKKINIMFKFLWFFSSLFIFGLTYYNNTETSIELNQILGIILMTYSATIILYLLYYILNEIETLSIDNSSDDYSDDCSEQVKTNSLSLADKLYFSIKNLIICLGIISFLLYFIFAYIYECCNPSLFSNQISEDIHYAFLFSFLPLLLTFNIKYKIDNIKINYILKCISLMFFIFVLFCCAFKISIVVNPIVNLAKSHYICILLFYCLANIFYKRDVFKRLFH